MKSLSLISSLLPAAAGLFVSTACGQAPATVAPFAADIAYAALSPAQALDLYRPEGEGPFPLVIYVHGGAFLAGDKAMNASDFPPLIAAGYAVASVNYRLSGEALFPAQIHDVKAAVRWLRANAAAYRLDPDRFAAWGASAGGTLVALLGVSGDVPALEDLELGNAGVSSRVRAVVDWFGPTDFGQMDAQFAAAGVCGSAAQSHSDPKSAESKLLGAPVATAPERVAAASPMAYVTADDPPFLIQHGTQDCTVPPGQSQALYDALAGVLAPGAVTLTVLEGAGHGGPPFVTAENMAIVTAFLDENVK